MRHPRFETSRMGLLALAMAAVAALLPAVADARADLDLAPSQFAPSETAPQYETDDYGIEQVSAEAVTRPDPDLPDVSKYNGEAVEQRLAQRPAEAPNVTVERIAGVSALGISWMRAGPGNG